MLKTMEELLEAKTLGVTYTGDAIHVNRAILLYGVASDEVKVWDNKTALVLFYNASKEKVAEFYFFADEIVEIDYPTIRVIREA